MFDVMKDEDIFCLELINEYDTDGSGQIEFPEFCNMMSGIIIIMIYQESYQITHFFSLQQRYEATMTRRW